LIVKNGLKLPKNTVAVMSKVPKVISAYLFFLKTKKSMRKLALFTFKGKK
jgi:hypothetical protein